MSRVNRLIYALTISFLALAPVTAAAAATPSPTLDKLLLAPPTGYTALTSSAFHGSFTAHDYAVASDSTQATEIEKTLTHDGFVDGYGETWIHQASQRAMVHRGAGRQELADGGRGGRQGRPKLRPRRLDHWDQSLLRRALQVLVQ